MTKDLRTFLSHLKERAPEELESVSRAVGADFELTGILRRLQAENRYPAVVFEQIRDRKLRVVSNVLGSERLLAEALETNVHELTRTYIERENNRKPIEMASEAPVQEVVLRGDEVNLYDMPIVVNCEKDSGSFITAGVTTV